MTDVAPYRRSGSEGEARDDDAPAFARAAGFRDPFAPAVAAAVLLGIAGLGSIFWAYASYRQIGMHIETRIESIQPVDWISWHNERRLGQVAVAARIAALVPFSVFVWRASSNLLVLGTDDVRFSPRAALAWVLAPCVNVVSGFVVVSELVRASALPDEDGKRGRTPMVLFGWWAMFLASLVASYFAAQSGRSSVEFMTSRLAASIGWLFDAVTFVFVALTLFAIRARQVAYSLSYYGRSAREQRAYEVRAGEVVRELRKQEPTARRTRRRRVTA